MDPRTLLFALALFASACSSAVTAETQVEDTPASTEAPATISQPDEALAFEDSEETSPTTEPPGSTTTTTEAGATEEAGNRSFDELVTQVAVQLDNPSAYQSSRDGSADERPSCAPLNADEPELLARSGFRQTIECLPETFWGPNGFDPPQIFEVEQLWYEVHLVTAPNVTTREFVDGFSEIQDFDASQYDSLDGTIELACPLLPTDHGQPIPELPCSAIWRYEITSGGSVLFIAVQGLDQSGVTQASALAPNLLEILETLDQLATA